MHWLRWSLIAGVVLALADGRPAWGWPSPLSLDVEQAASAARTNAILPLTFSIHHNGTSVLEGDLVYLVSGGNGAPGYFRQHVVLSPGQNRFGGVVRTSATFDRNRQLVLKADFITSQGRIDLGTHPLRVSDILGRKFVVAVCETDAESRLTPWQDFAGQLRFEQFNADKTRRQGTTSLAHIAPMEFPENALELCAYDMVLVSPLALPALKDKSLQALLTWVEAGGSVCVVPTAPMDQRHAAFLNALIKEHPQLTPFVLNASGQIVSSLPAGQESDSRLLAHKGLGTVAILLRDTSVKRSYDSTDWRRMVTFLWRYRSDQQADVLRRGTWTVPRLQTFANNPYGNQFQQNAYRDTDGRNQIELAPTPGGNLSPLVNRLIPDGLRVVPFSLMGLILAGYVALIGPVDYFLLGWIKKRKWTWFTFPLVTAGMAVFTIWLIESYMATPDNRKAVVILDVNAEGKVLRANRFDLLFASGNRTVAAEVQHALFVPFDSDSTFVDESYGRNPYGYRNSNFGGSSDAGVVAYDGQFPLRYAVTQGVRQWTPQLNRRMYIAPTDETLAHGVKNTFDWSRSDDVITQADKPRTNRVSDVVDGLSKALKLKRTEKTAPQDIKKTTDQHAALVRRIIDAFCARVSAYLLSGSPDENNRSHRLTRLIGNVPLFADEAPNSQYGWQTVYTPTGPQKVYIAPASTGQRRLGCSDERAADSPRRSSQCPVRAT